MIDFDVSRALEDDDYPWLEITRSISAVDQYLKLLNDFLPHITDQTMLRFMAEFEKKLSCSHPEDLAIDLEGLRELTEETVPLFFYGSFIIALWAAFESSLNDIAAYVQKKEHSPLRLSELREQNIGRKLALYIESVMRRPLEIPNTLSKDIESLQLIRNCLAHANGDLRQQKEERRRNIEAVVTSDVGVFTRSGKVIVNGLFARSSLLAVVSYINLLFAGLHRAYPLTMSDTGG